MNIASKQWIQIFKIPNNNFSIFGKAFTYKSAYSLDKLYPTHSIKLFTPTFVPEDPNAKFSGYIPIKELNITYSRSSGAGGQHVNCTNSKVDIRFHLQSAKWLSEEIKSKLLEQYKNKLSKEGYLIIKSELTRSQQLNLADALRKLRETIWEATKPPPETSPETLELKRKQELTAARKRLFEKRKHSMIKQFKKAPMDF
ncbi:peptidyl-tRNA hydrolase ICT1, mitochondrial [Apis mellifera caucasica]|uniref:Large ribosomal subunit protein mL62 n=1 Tax=Apis mellifera TaxID=7460 RepID=A0A7M7R6B6_APIME|nr:peptidyl-tRNA hydrolase ICT1, mitochondrial [Apis mellifera]KAG6799612.1 peptidyl-tRNA hydrolase ICT1, mitochondrial [Apis mellifera caucasica]|eukprot:XP_393856.2 peptidyl-tRNA hydrolase ICT1, mitochondrial [Apis mellifera]